MKNTLLIVDDDQTSLTALYRILRKEYTVYEATDGAGALRMAREYVPDLIILDILMPDMDGFQILSTLQTSEETSRIPVIFITGLNSQDDEQKGLGLGAVDYIHKPFNGSLVKLRVRHQIQTVNQMRSMEQLSMIDALTKIPNRRSFDCKLESEWGRAIRESLPISLLLIDIDDFKRHNDSYGHHQGDKVLCLIAETLTRTLKRTTDFAARWGGEEFVVLLPNTDADGGLSIGEQLRKGIEGIDIPLEDGSYTQVTASIGVMTQTPAVTCSVYDFFSGADAALYKAKGSGKNRVCLYEEKEEEMVEIELSDIRIPGIDAEAGSALYSGEMDIYLAVLQSFAANIPAALEKMGNVTEERLREYTTTVHGLKGACASIGAVGLQERALQLEVLSKDGDISGVLSLNGEVIQDTHSLLHCLNAWLAKFSA